MVLPFHRKLLQQIHALLHIYTECWQPDENVRRFRNVDVTYDVALIVKALIATYIHKDIRSPIQSLHIFKVFNLLSWHINEFRAHTSSKNLRKEEAN